MKRDINIFIDSIMKDDDKKTIALQGWGINEKDRTPLKPNVKANDNIVSVVIKEKYRGDINVLYNLSVETNCGFLIIIQVKKFEGMARVQFNSHDEHRRISLNLKRPYKLTNEFGSPLSGLYLKLKRGANYFRRNGFINTLRKAKIELGKSTASQYEEWIKKNENDEPEGILKEIENFKYQPKISIVMPVYNVEKIWLEKCINSVKEQYYQNWELCIADDCSTKPHVKPMLEDYCKNDGRIKVVFRTENGHICEATNSALSIATGEFIGLLDNDDELAPFALYEVVKLLNENPEFNLIYSDEDKIDKFGKRSEAVFKSDWSPDMLMGTNYICHFGVYRKTIVDEIGGFRKGYEGAQDYDLVLRFTEKTDKIGHVPRVLYHWRMLETSTAVNQDSKNYAFEAGKKALEDALKRRNIEGTVEHGQGLGLYDVRYKIIKTELVSIIIPTRDGYDDLKKCVDSIVELTTYPNYEIIIADNGTTDERVLSLFEEYKKKLKNCFQVVRIDIPFNFSKINNIAAKEAKGKYLLFLNNDTKVLTKDWIAKMVSFAQFDRIGAVGAKLCYADNTIQHAGVILGMGGAAGHGHLDFPRDDFGYFGRLAINCNYSAVTAACMIVKKSDFEAVQGFNEELSIAFNDVDFCLRLMEYGKNNVWLHDVILYHYESKSRGMENTIEKQQRFNEEADYMYRQWKKYILNDPHYNPNLVRNNGNYSLNMN